MIIKISNNQNNHFEKSHYTNLNNIWPVKLALAFITRIHSFPSLPFRYIGICHGWLAPAYKSSPSVRGYCRVSVDTFPRHQEKLGGSVPWSGAALQRLLGFLLNVCQHLSFTALLCWNVTRMPCRGRNYRAEVSISRAVDLAGKW